MVLGPYKRHPSLVFTHMVTISIILCLLGSFFLYSTSQKMQTVNAEFQTLSVQQLKVRKLVGLLLLIASYIALGIYAGYTAAAIYFILVVTLAFSLLILLYPLRVVNKLGLLIVMIVSLAIEFLI